MVDSGMSQEMAALKAGMARKTARKYLSGRRLPSEVTQPRTYRTREDPFDEVWPDVEALLEADPALQSRTLFDWLQRERPHPQSTATSSVPAGRIARPGPKSRRRSGNGG